MSSDVATLAPRFLKKNWLLQAGSFVFLADVLVYFCVAPLSLLVRTNMLEHDSILAGASLESTGTLAWGNCTDRGLDVCYCNLSLRDWAGVPVSLDTVFWRGGNGGGAALLVTVCCDSNGREGWAVPVHQWEMLQVCALHCLSQLLTLGFMQWVSY